VAGCYEYRTETFDFQINQRVSSSSEEDGVSESVAEP
jgi:hypothetical protein